MRTLGNILWFVLGGFITGTIYMIIGALFCLTIIGIPIGKAMFQYGKLMYFPFGKAIVRETFIKGEENVSMVRRIGGIVINIIWFPVGIFLFFMSIGSMIVCCLTIILIPVAVVIARSCVFLLFPIGAKVISIEEKQAILTANALEKRGILNKSTTVNTYVAIGSETASINVDMQQSAPAEPSGFETFYNNTLIPFFNKFKAGVSTASKAAAKKSGDLIEITKLSTTIGGKEKEISNLYKMLGTKCFNEKERITLPQDSVQMCSNIMELLNEVELLKEKINEIKRNESTPVE